MARMDGTILKFFDKAAKTSLLILDDFGLTHFEQQQQLDLWKLLKIIETITSGGQYDQRRGNITRISKQDFLT